MATADRLDLQRADSGQSLWAAVEGAQYARMIKAVEPDNDEEADRMQAFIDLFADCAERWEQIPPPDQAHALQQLGHLLAQLSRIGVFVHSGVAPGHFQAAAGGPVDVPIVVLAIGRDAAPRIEIEIPAAVAAG